MNRKSCYQLTCQPQTAYLGFKQGCFDSLCWIIHKNEILTKYIFLFRQSRWRFWAPVNERSLRWIQQRFSPCIQQEQSGECWVRCRLQPACRFGNTAMLFLLVILFNFHRWLQKGGHFINYENTHCFLHCFFFMRQEVASLKLQSLPPTDTLIALKGLQNDLCKIVLMASRGLVFLYVGSLKAVINDILKLRNCGN